MIKNEREHLTYPHKLIINNKEKRAFILEQGADIEYDYICFADILNYIIKMVHLVVWW